MHPFRILLPAFACSLLASCSHSLTFRTPPAALPSHRKAFESAEPSIQCPHGTYQITMTRHAPSPRGAVLLLHEINGQTEGSLALAEKLSYAGYRVYVPRFYGKRGTNIAPGLTWLGVSLSPKWALLCPEGGSIREDIAVIVRHIHAQNPKQPLTVIGNCMTGGQALALLPEPYVKTAVICQPAAPFFNFTERRRHAFGIPEITVDSALAALQADRTKRLISFNYRDDQTAPLERTAHLASRTADSAAGRRHQLYIGIPHGQPDDSPATHTLLQHPGWHRVEVFDTREHHSTVTGATAPRDLESFQRALWKALDLPAATYRPDYRL